MDKVRHRQCAVKRNAVPQRRDEERYDRLSDCNRKVGNARRGESRDDARRRGSGCNKLLQIIMSSRGLLRRALVKQKAAHNRAANDSGTRCGAVLLV